MTKKFENYSAFLARENKTENGVSESFAKDNSNWKQENDSNEGCWNCSRCSDCSDCSRCSDEANKKGTERGDEAFKVPVVKNIHSKIYEATSQPNALDMSDWHTCETTHCRAGWVVFLAGEEGKKLENKTCTLFAAMQIYKKSSPIKVSPVRFFEDNKTALADIKKCAELE